MKEEGRVNPSQYTLERAGNKNLCISGKDAKQVSNESWGITIFEKGKVRELMV